MKILIIGCGHIAGFGSGALRPNHAKSIKQSFQDAQVNCFDIDSERAISFAEYYGFYPIDDLTNQVLSEYNLVVCATPANTRYDIMEWLAREISDNALVLLEKPIADGIVEKDRLASCSERFFVNFPRSFQTGIGCLKQAGLPQPKKIIVHYYKDIVSIGIHAFQLLSDFFDGISIQNVEAFDEDYRVEMQWQNNVIPSYFLNSGNEHAEIFEIDIFFEHSRLRLSTFTEKVELFDAVENDAGEKELLLTSSHDIGNDGFNVLYEDLSQALNGKGVSQRLASVNLHRSVKVHNAVIRHFSGLIK